MDNNRLSYAITSFTPQEINEKFLEAKHTFSLYIDQAVTQQYGVITKNEAHITMRRAFYLKEGCTEEQIVAALDSLQISPVPITATKLKVFQSEKFGNVLVALVDKTPGLLTIYNDISTAITDFIEIKSKFEGDNFTPHLSIGYNIPDEKLTEVIAHVTKNILPLSYSLNNFHLLRDIPQIKGERVFVKSYNFS